MGNASRFEIGDAVVELDTERVVETIRQRNVNVVLRFHTKDPRVTDQVIRKAAGRIHNLRAVMTNTRIELYLPLLRTMEDVIDLAESFSYHVDRILRERDQTIAAAKAAKKASRNRYRNSTPMAR